MNKFYCTKCKCFVGKIEINPVDTKTKMLFYERKRRIRINFCPMCGLKLLKLGKNKKITKK